MTDLCEVCNENKPIGVACVPGIPLSVAYCERCLREGIHPLWAIRANVACCGGLEHMHDYCREIKVYHPTEKVITIQDEINRRPLTQEELK